MSFRSMAHIFLDRIDTTPDQIAFEFRRQGKWVQIDWRTTNTEVRDIACALLQSGINKGDRCAILSGTRIEWILVDLGILCAGAVTTTIYASNTPEDCAYILNHSGATVCFVEDCSQLEKLREIVDALETLQQIIIIDPEEPIEASQFAERGITLHRLDAYKAMGRQLNTTQPTAYRERIETIQPEDLATLIYTSGTTGAPKGVMLLHDCWIFQAESIAKGTKQYMEPNDKQYVFLPLAHSYAKVLELVGIAFGAITVVDGDIDYFIKGVQETQPALIPAVPRVFEKAYHRIVQRAETAGGWKQALFQWANAVGQRIVDAQMKGERRGLRLSFEYALADRIVFRRLRAAFGGKVRAFVSGGAPLRPDIAAFFFAAGMPILEGYGLTETAAVATANKVEQFRLGTVGMPGEGTQINIAADGEILLKSRSIMKGYFKMPEATAEAIKDGWFHTGDIGSIDADGFLRITGRKKDIIITAGGKNIAPQTIENRIKSASPYISEVVMHGDRRPYCVALLTMDSENVREWASKIRDLEQLDTESLSQHPMIHELLWGAVEQINTTLASYETIKYINILPRELSIESGELTPSMKVKRRIVEQHYKTQLDAMYEHS